jgi:hypothetical protein
VYKRQIFHREGREQYPIDVHRVEIHSTTQAIVDKMVKGQGHNLFRKFFDHEMQWRLRKIGAR